MIFLLSGLVCLLALLVYIVLRRQPGFKHFLLAAAAFILVDVGLLQLFLTSLSNPVLSRLKALGVTANPYQILLQELAAGEFDKVIRQIGANPPMMSQIMTWAAALILVSGGLILWLRRKHNPQNRSASTLLAGAGLLLAVVPVMTRTTAGALKQPAEDVAQAAAVTPTATLFATNTPTLIVVTPEAPKRTLFVETPVPTRYVYSPATPTDVASAAATAPQCSGTTLNNLNLRAEPSISGQLIVTIPHSTPIELLGKSSDATWLWVRESDQVGWVSADYVVQNSNCPTLPVHNP
ncbi:MAG: SH3 domain-containing protein [Chloroflexi bacterium]|nr:SH3 domain-containing protein [Chloroflexota bacterium]